MTADVIARSWRSNGRSATLDPIRASSPVVKLTRLRLMRERAALSQRDLARAAGVAEATIRNVEHGDDPRPSTIRKLAAALGVRPSDLMDPLPREHHS
jgi:DNA-binding XRE family transcriptional regulator